MSYGIIHLNTLNSAHKCVDEKAQGILNTTNTKVQCMNINMIASEKKLLKSEVFLHVEVKQLQGFCINKFPLHILTYCCMFMSICIDSGGELVLYKLFHASNSGL